jgi:hypothetical protein
MLMTLRLALAALTLTCMGLTCMGARVSAGGLKGVVVELFTSQGCVSCPPADAFLAELAARPGVIALSQHVDYWNYLGWTDPFSNAHATKRQHAYREMLKTKFVYTPQMVVDGGHEAPGSDRDTIFGAIEKAANKLKLAIAVSHPKSGTLRVTVPSGAAPEKPASVWLVFYSAREMTTISAGENRGVVLTNVNVVRDMRRIGTWTGAALTIDVPVAEIEPPNAGSCAVLVQIGQAGQIVGAITVPVAHKGN